MKKVAAKVEDESGWILARIEKHNEKKGFFVVVDDDAGDDKRRYSSMYHKVPDRTNACLQNRAVDFPRMMSILFCGCFVSCMLGS